jgi:hypothetical protein
MRQPPDVLPRIDPLRFENAQGRRIVSPRRHTASTAESKTRTFAQFSRFSATKV